MPEEPRPIITLLTDFGEADGFVGVMKGVILGIAPRVELVDLSHLIHPQDIRQAAFVLMTAVPFFPAGTVHLVVVDPGVGSRRRPIAVEISNAYFVAPDNGVLSYSLAQAGSYEAVELTDPRFRLSEVSNTFHGRDIFSPAAAHLAAGLAIEELGPACSDLLLLDTPRLKADENRIEAEVLNVDHFGNLRTSILKFTWENETTLLLQPIFGREGSQLIRIHAPDARTRCGSLEIDGISATFSDVEVGEAVAFVGSEGGLEIAINQGSASRVHNIRRGDPVSLRF
ncbi:MAG: S-adenosyl-l-methionine hydroxide adenosyltransferase family protein [Anaerolineales bacterium]